MNDIRTRIFVARKSNHFYRNTKEPDGNNSESPAGIRAPRAAGLQRSDPTRGVSRRYPLRTTVGNDPTEPLRRTDSAPRLGKPSRPNGPSDHPEEAPAQAAPTKHTDATGRTLPDAQPARTDGSAGSDLRAGRIAPRKSGRLSAPPQSKRASYGHSRTTPSCKVASRLPERTTRKTSGIRNRSISGEIVFSKPARERPVIGTYSARRRPIRTNRTATDTRLPCRATPETSPVKLPASPAERCMAAKRNEELRSGHTDLYIRYPCGRKNARNPASLACK